MPPKKKRSGGTANSRSIAKLLSRLRPAQLISDIYAASWNPHYMLHFLVVLLCLESGVVALAIFFRPYTEIDWTTYMQQVDTFAKGERFYPNIKGDTGICPYPAGHLYAYQIFALLSDGGSSIFHGQIIFAILYLVNLVLVALIYKKTTFVPPIALVTVCLTSYRLHSIFVLRMFNDAVTMTLVHAAILLLLNRQFFWSTLLYSLSLSVKMNVLLFLPGFAAILCISQGYLSAFLNAVVIVAIQVLLGLPFLIHYPVAYITSAYNFGRHFLFKWTVNWRFLDPAVFGSETFHRALLAAHIVTLVAFALAKWARPRSLVKLLLSNRSSLTDFIVKSKASLQPQDMAFIMFTCNFIGIMFSRTLHYQFYSWYYYSLPILLWSTSYSTSLKFLIWGLVELCWNTYPSTNWSSALLHVCHSALLVGLTFFSRDNTSGKRQPQYVTIPMKLE